MTRATLSWATALLLTAVTHRAQAFVGDQWNLNAPGSLGWSATYSEVAARKSDGSIWVKQTNPTVGSWSSLGNPSGGTSSGPQIGTFHNYSLGQDQTYYVVRGPYPSDPGNIWERHYTSNTGWSSWAPTFGMPPSGTRTAPTVGYDQYGGLLIAVLDTNWIPWVRGMNSDGSLTDWLQAGTQALDSVPGAVISPNQDWGIFGLMNDGRIYQSQCLYEHCFDTWTEVPGMGRAAAGPLAVGYIDPSSNDDITVAVFGTDSHPYINTSIGGTFGSWNYLAGSPADSAVSVLYFWTTHSTIETVHRPDGNFWTGQGGGWSSIGHP
jgi:hypothetical protein